MHIICTRHDFHDDDNLGCPWCHCDEKDAIIETLKEECRLGYNVLHDLALKDSEFTRLENFCDGVQHELTEALDRESALIQKLWKTQRAFVWLWNDEEEIGTPIPKWVSRAVKEADDDLRAAEPDERI